MSNVIAMVGPGRMGLSLGSALAQSDGADALLYLGRSPEPPPHPLFEGSVPTSYRTGYGPLPPEVGLLILAVPDDAVHEVANEVARSGPVPRGCVALHLSGALSTDALAPLQAVGYSVGSLHPLQTVADPWSGAQRLRGCAFALAGDPAALMAARRVVNALDGRPLVIPPSLRPLYHAAAVFASNYVLAATAVLARTLAEAGIDEADAIAAALPLMRGTLDNVDELGFRAALTGPVARGDIDTVRLHLSRLSSRERTLYCAVGLETLGLARAAGLDAVRAEALEALLSDG
jgi:predicted short-subunit dehydrogenase-like oxidoreductase (DUF2520 family)